MIFRSFALSRRTTSLFACTALALTGCSSSSSDTPAPPTPEAGSEASDTTCAKSVIGIAFKPMYSGYDGTHKFQIPAVVPNIAPDAITWAASDPSKVDLVPMPIQNEDGVIQAGVMITTREAGTVSIIAHAGTICGSSTLTITQFAPTEWEAGNQRYNNGTTLGGLNSVVRPMDGSVEAKCTNCHGDTADGPFKTVAHTPWQTGGFSDDDLLNIFRHGSVPDGGYFDEGIVSYQLWSGFHRWEMTDDEAKGIIAYLRSLTPQPQMGAINFGGQARGDGGGGREGGGGNFGDGGFVRPEGGMGRGDGGFVVPEGGFGNRDAMPEATTGTPDAGTAEDAGTPDASVVVPTDASLAD
jgi:hypothetical protein